MISQIQSSISQNSWQSQWRIKHKHNLHSLSMELASSSDKGASTRQHLSSCRQLHFILGYLKKNWRSFWMKVKTSQSNQERSSKLSPPQLTTLTLDNKLTNFLKQQLSSQMVADQLFAMEHNKIVSGTWAWAPHLEKQALQQIKGSFGLHGHKLSSSIIITDPHGPNSFIRPSLSTTRWR